jgi:hypothetical protein
MILAHGALITQAEDVVEIETGIQFAPDRRGVAPACCVLAAVLYSARKPVSTRLESSREPTPARRNSLMRRSWSVRQERSMRALWPEGAGDDAFDPQFLQSASHLSGKPAASQFFLQSPVFVVRTRSSPRRNVSPVACSTARVRLLRRPLTGPAQRS